MILVKCKCGCFSSITDSSLKSGLGVDKSTQTKHFTCQNCYNSFSYRPGPGHGIQYFIEPATQAGMVIQMIPDKSDIKVSFPLNEH